MPPQRLGAALQALATERRFQIIYVADDVEMLRTLGAVGDFTTQEALSQLLRGTGLTYRLFNDDGVSIVRIGSDQSPTNAESSIPAFPAEVRATDATVDGFDGSHDKREFRGFLRPMQAGQHASRGLASDTPPGAAAAAVEEVIVTASKRSERIQDLPASITALSTAEIRQRGLVGMEDYLRSVPGLSYIDRGVANNSIVIRGLTADAQNYTDMGGTVGIYLGDTPLAGLAVSGNNADIKLVDMERVEVLRGPQGTLYGDGALGGAVRNIPVAPDLNDLDGFLKTGYSRTGEKGGNNWSAEGVVNMPIVEGTLALRAVGYRFETSGYIDNIAATQPAFLANAKALGFADLAVNQHDVGNSTYMGGRATLLWRPTGQLHASVLLLSQNLVQDGLPEVQLGLGTYQQTRLQISEDYRGGSERLLDRLSLGNLELGYDLGWGNLFSSTAYVEETGLLVRDIAAVFGNVPTPQVVDLTSRALTEELRLTSDLPGSVQFIVGLYFNDGVKRRYSDAFKLTSPSTVLDLRFRDATATQTALFGELTYAVTDHLKATLGVRAFEYDQEFVTTSSIGSGPSVATTENSSNSDQIHKAALTYQPSRDALIYAQWAEGFRLGAPQASPPASVCDINDDGLIDGTQLSSKDRRLDPDSMDSYELGAKFSLMEHRFNLSAALYRNEWTGIPVVILVPCGFGQFVNAGEARTQGVELEGTLRLLRDLTLTLGASYVDAVLSKDAPGVGLQGDRLPGSPRYNISAAIRYGFEIAELPALVRADYLKTGGFYNNLASTGIEIADYSLVNVRGSIAFGQTTVEMYVNNLTNEDALTWLDSVFVNSDARASRLRPRTMGLSVRYQF